MLSNMCGIYYRRLPHMKDKNLQHYLSYTYTDENGCMIWKRCFNTDGYPRANIRGNCNGKVHREVYMLNTGEDIDGKVIRHKCDNPRCINPEHLESGTPADNVRDMDKRQRRGNSKLTHNQVRAIRSLANNFKRRELAKMFGVNERTISSIILRRHWKHLS